MRREKVVVTRHPELGEKVYDGEVWEIQAPDGARFLVRVTDGGTKLICPSGFRVSSSYPRAWIAKRGESLVSD